MIFLLPLYVLCFIISFFEKFSLIFFFLLAGVPLKNTNTRQHSFVDVALILCFTCALLVLGLQSDAVPEVLPKLLL